MSRPFRTALATALAALSASQAHADVVPVTFTDTSAVVVTGGVPVARSATISGLTNVLGFTLNGDWTAVSPDMNNRLPFSDEFTVRLAGPGGFTAVEGNAGGVPNANPFRFPIGGPPTFPVSIAATGGMIVAPFQGGRLALTNFAPSTIAAGTLTATFDTRIAGTTAQVAGASLDFYTNPASATGTTTGGTTYNRPTEFADSTPSGVQVNYATQTLTVSATGRYLFGQVTAAAGQDGFLSLYGPGGFDPANPLTNLRALSDDESGVDFPSKQQSGLVADLTAGTTYTLVSAGLTASDAGTFTLYGAGVGTVTFAPVPEPTTVLLAAGAALVGGRAVRRRAVGS